MKQDFTEGAIARKLLIFAVSLIATNMIQQLYNMVDLIFAGKLLDENASAAIGASCRLITCIISLFSGMAVGSGVVISNAFGAKNVENIRCSVWNALALAVIAGCGFSVFAFCFSRTYLVLLGTNAAILEEAYDYLSIYALSLFAGLLYNMCAAVLRAVGEAKTPFLSQVIAGTVNIALDAITVVVFKMGIRGIALATMGSQTIAAVIVLWRVLCLEQIRFFRGEFPRLQKRVLGSILRIGVPAGLQAFLITFSNVIGQFYVNMFEIPVVAGFAVFSKVDNFIYIPVFSCGQAVMTFVAQNHGADQTDRIKKGVRYTLIGGTIMAWCLSAMLLLSAETLCGVFTNSAAVVSASVDICGMLFPCYFLYVYLQVFGDAMRGLGYARAPMWIVIVNMLGLRTLLFSVLVPRFGTLESYTVVYPISWLATAACMAILYYSVRKRLLATKPRVVAAQEE